MEVRDVCFETDPTAFVSYCSPFATIPPDDQRVGSGGGLKGGKWGGGGLR